MANARPPKAMISELIERAKSSFIALRNAHPKEHFYFYAFFTTPEGNSVNVSAASEEALERTVAAYRKRDERYASEAVSQRLRYSMADSPYHLLDEALPDLERGPALHEACFHAMAELDRDGFFGRGAARDGVIVNVVYGDMSDERWLAHAERLNPPAAVKRSLPYLRLHLVSGKVERWGASAYQVNAVSLSADAKTVAYSGSGGDVAILDIAKRKASVAKKNDGEHWACALAPDGSALYVGEKEGVSLIDAKTGEKTRFATTKKPRSIVVSADGKRVAVYSDSLDVFDAATKKRLWTAKIGGRVARFSPDGTSIVVTSQSVAPKNRVLTLACFDAANGQERWSVPLGDGSSAGVAWHPDGKRILASVSQTTFANGARESTSVLGWHSPNTGRLLQKVPWTNGADTIAISATGGRIGLGCGSVIAILDLEGKLVGRGTGAHEQMLDVAFAGDDLLAVGRDVNRGPAILQLRAP